MGGLGCRSREPLFVKRRGNRDHYEAVDKLGHGGCDR